MGIWDASVDWVNDRVDDVKSLPGKLDRGTSGQQQGTLSRVRQNTDRLQQNTTDIKRPTPQVGTYNANAVQRNGTGPAYDARASRVNAPVPVSAQNVDATLNTDPQAQVRAQQQALNGLLQDRVAGNATSVAELQGQRMLDRNIGNQMGLASAMQGRSPGGALRQVSNATGNLNANAAADATLLRAQEQAQAEATLGGLLGNQRAQDIGLAATEADLGLRADLANQGANLQADLANQGATTQVDLANAGMATDVSKHNAAMDNSVMVGNADRAQQGDVAQGQLELGSRRTDDQFNLGNEELVLEGLNIERGPAQGVDQARAGLIGSAFDAAGALLF